MSASFRRGTAPALARACPCRLVAVHASLAAGAGTVLVYDGVDATGDLVATLAVNASSAAFCPALPIVLRRGLFVDVTNACEYTVVWL